MAKKAVLIGINRYRMPGADLRGCVNDVRAMTQSLTARFGFKPADIVTLVDEQATTAAMRKAIKKLVTGGKKGDILFLHYSGHGSQVPDANGDEADRRDEIICPHDLDWSDPIDDDWLRSTFNGLKKGVNLTVLMDCCHSGSNTREVPAADATSRARYLPNPLDIMATESGRALRGRKTNALRGGAKKNNDTTVIDLAEVHVSGCRDTQTSADAFLEGKFQGALTCCFVQSLAAAPATSTMRTLLDATRAALKKGGFDQVPQLNGRAENLDRAFLTPAVAAKSKSGEA